ncbi:High-affinity nickel-transporter [Planosporangium thailandense]|uniref:High-affinity nickel-transporter n=1 Tax=Planosporangium thailandense TaxID=765197 RepID=A0ABX0XXK9_9ACTN|nr:High-affinity nickel-transporter [Planosporangium thailandense]
MEVTAVVDTAEIPTLQERADVDANHDGQADEAERAAYAAKTCRELAGGFEVQAAGKRLEWTVTGPAFEYAPGAGGLQTSRLTCTLTGPAKLGAGAGVTVTNRWRTDRVGWREMTAVGDGVRLVDSPLPARSVSDQLRSYPADLLSSRLDVRTASLRTQPAGSGADARGSGVRPAAAVAGSDPVTRWMNAADRRLQQVAAGRRITPVVGILAVLAAVLLGAGHAALPGHGKTVMAAYLAGERGRVRDAMVVGATVTLTHTGAVLVIGALLSASSALAGDRLLGYLGLASGILVTAVGVGMLVGALRRRGGHGHSHHGHSHSHHGHGHSHSHGDHSPHGHPHSHGDHSHHDHDHGGSTRVGKLGLAGIGLAGGLVPSPSALVVLLGAIGLGRAGFGILLVVGYGLGMAAALTGAGLLLLFVSRRVTATARWPRLVRRLSPFLARVPAATSTLTAGLVTIVGLGLALRAAAGVL